MGPEPEKFSERRRDHLCWIVSDLYAGLDAHGWGICFIGVAWPITRGTSFELKCH